jgi:hypothetical protein
MRLSVHPDTAGEVPPSGERSDTASVGARFIAPAGWGVAYTGVSMLNSPAESILVKFLSRRGKGGEERRGGPLWSPAVPLKDVAVSLPW